MDAGTRVGVGQVEHILTLSCVAGEVPRGSRPQSSSHLIALMQYKIQACTASGIDTSKPFFYGLCMHTWNEKAISRESRDVVGPAGPGIYPWDPSSLGLSSASARSIL